jgi:transcription initiation factor IIE alpha subunit
MSNALQFTTDGKMYKTLEAIPYQGYISSIELSEALKIEPKIAAARLKLLYDSGTVRRERIGICYYYTRGKEVTPPEVTAQPTEAPTMSDQDDTVSYRPKIAEHLRANIGKQLSLKSIVSKTGAPLDVVRKMMRGLHAADYVVAYEDGTYEPKPTIEKYRPLIHKKQPWTKTGSVKPVSVENLAEGILKMQKQNGDYRAALQMIADIVTEALKNG